MKPLKNKLHSIIQSEIFLWYRKRNWNKERLESG